MAFHVEVNFSGFPFAAGFGQEGRAEPQEGGFIGEDAGDAGAAFEFLIYPFQRIGGAQAAMVVGSKDGLARGYHAGVVAADDELSAAETALNQTVEEGVPMHFSFAEGDADAEQGALAAGRDAERDEDGAIPEL